MSFLNPMKKRREEAGWLERRGVSQEDFSGRMTSELLSSLTQAAIMTVLRVRKAKLAVGSQRDGLTAPPRVLLPVGSLGHVEQIPVPTQTSEPQINATAFAGKEINGEAECGSREMRCDVLHNSICR